MTKENDPIKKFRKKLSAEIAEMAKEAGISEEAMWAMTHKASVELGSINDFSPILNNCSDECGTWKPLFGNEAGRAILPGKNKNAVKNVWVLTWECDSEFTYIDEENENPITETFILGIFNSVDLAKKYLAEVEIGEENVNKLMWYTPQRVLLGYQKELECPRLLEADSDFLQANSRYIIQPEILYESTDWE